MWNKKLGASTLPGLAILRQVDRLPGFRLLNLTFDSQAHSCCLTLVSYVDPLVKSLCVEIGSACIRDLPGELLFWEGRSGVLECLGRRFQVVFACHLNFSF